MKLPMKKLFAILLSLLLIVGLFPVSVLAESQPVAKIGAQEYTNLPAAVTAAQKGDTIMLLADVQLSAALDVQKSITIDCQNHTISAADNFADHAAIMIGESGWTSCTDTEITIKNGVFTGFTSTHGVLRVQGVTANIVDCTFTANTQTLATYAIVSYNYATGAISGCTFTDNYCQEVIDVNSQPNKEYTSAAMSISNNSIKNNTVTSNAALYYARGNGITIENNHFEANVLIITDNAGVIYFSEGENCTVVNNVFVGNKLPNATPRCGVALLECDMTFTGNAFMDNELNESATFKATVLNKADAGTAPLDLSGNYWGGDEPDYATVKGAESSASSYYTSFKNGTLGALVSNTPVINVANDAELQAALANIKDGDTIQLAATSFGAFDWSALEGTDGVTIIGAEGTTVAGTYRSRTNDVFFDNVTFKGITFTKQVHTSNCAIDGITFDDCRFVDGAWLLLTGYGSVALNNATVKNCTFNGSVEKSLSLQNASKNVIIQNNTFTNCGTNAIHADTVSGDYLIEGNVINGSGDRAIRLATTNGANVTIKNNAITNGANAKGEIIKITGAVLTATIEGNTHNGNAIVFTNDGENVGVEADAKETAQLALDNAVSGTTIQLQPGVNYGTLYVRANPGHSNTQDIDVVNAYNNDYLRTFHNIKIYGAQGATVDAIIFQSGAVSGLGYVRIDIKDLLIEGVEFTNVGGEHFDDNDYPAILLRLADITFDGITIKDCTRIGQTDSNFFRTYAHNSVVEDNSVAKNLTITGCVVDGSRRFFSIYPMENVTITNNIIKNTSQHGMHFSGLKSYLYTGTVTITDNRAEGIAERFVRMTAADVATVVIKNNTVTNYLGGDPDYIKVTEADNKTPAKHVTLENNKLISSKVAEVNGVEYATLAEAIAAANGATVTLLADVVLEDSLVIPANTTMTLDLAGHTISQVKECTDSYSMIKNEGNLTITGNGKISFKDTGAGDPEFGWGVYTVANHGTLVVENGIIENLSEQNTPGNVVHMYCAVQQGWGAVSTTINGGTISTPTYRSVRANCGELIINGGNFEGQIWIQPTHEDTTVEINGGTFAPRGGDGSSVFFTNVGDDNTVAEAVITGGTFTTKIGSSDATLLPMAISGGTFAVAFPEDWCAEGFAPTENADGTFGVEVYVPAVAEVNGVEYATLAEAIAAANGATVTLLTDIVLDANITIAKGDNVTIDLAGHTISTHIAQQLTASYAMFTNKGTLTIKDSADNGKISLTYGGASFGYGIGLYVISNEGGTLNVEGGTIENFATVTGSMYDAIDNNSTLGDTVLNIRGGSVYCGYLAIRQFSNSTSYENIVNAFGGNVKGGNSSIWTQNPSSNNAPVLATIVVSGGKFDGRILLGESDAFDVAVSGGSFTTAIPEDWCAEGFVPTENADGTFGVKVDPSVAEVNGVKYNTLAEAIAAAQYGDVIHLIADVYEPTATVVLPVGVTLDIQTYNLTLAYLVGFNGSHLIGASYKTNGSAYGQLNIPQNQVILPGEAYLDHTASGDFYVMPVWDPVNGCYVFGRYILNENESDDLGFTIDEENNQLKLLFKHYGSGTVNQTFFTDGTSDNNVTFLVKVTWTSEYGNEVTQDYKYSDTMVGLVMDSHAFVLTFTGYQECTNITITAMFVSGTGVTISGNTYVIN